VDAQKHVRKISVVPAPYTIPHPPVFVASSGSPESSEYCARKGFIPTYFTHIDKAEPMGAIYYNAAKEAGRNFALGQNQAIVRRIQISSTEAEARKALFLHDADIYKNFYAAMGRRPMSTPDDLAQAVIDSGIFYWGTVDQVRNEFVEQWKRLPAEYVVLIFHFAQMPKEEVIEQMEIFTKEIKPALDELTNYAEVPVAG
jgi:alkanesulfonate monooxygenase SsuD/methylene tetrahydromethanopterin reductase-like flavin-dependent oxidoreductase (luciferase family)